MLSLKIYILFAFMLIFLCLSINGKTIAKSDGLILECEQHWETYGVGGTCISGTHNIFVADVDNDNVIEIITGGSMYNVVNGSMTNREAPLKIWNWDGQILELEKSHNWDGNIRCVYSGNLNGDGTAEIITAGSVTNNTGSYSSLRIWSYDGEVLVLKGSYEGITVRSIFVSDVDKNGAPDILTVGTASNDNKSLAQLCLWEWDGNNLALRKSEKWCATTTASANSVYAYDLNNDGEIEIITGGYDNDLTNSSGQLCIWHWMGEEFSKEVNKEWRMVEGVYGLTIAGGPMGNTMVSNLKVGDVDGDGTAEIVTGGFTYDGEKVNAQLRIWNWNGDTLTLEKSHEWITKDITEVKAISLNDVDGDEEVDVVTSGISAVYGSFFDIDTIPEMAQLRVWSWNGKDITLKQNVDWQIGDGVCAWNVGTGDLDDDGIVEIVTVGCMYVSTLCDPDLRIWSIERESASMLYPFLASLGIVLTIVIIILFVFVKKRRGRLE